MTLGNINTQIKPAPAPPQTPDRINALKATYLADMKNKWQRYAYINGSVQPANDVSVRIGVNGRDVCTTVPDTVNGQFGYDRRTVFLEDSTEHIIILPAINGDINIYNIVRSYILNFPTPKNTVFIFAPGLLASPINEEQVKINKQIFYDILDLRYNIKLTIYMLTEVTGRTIKIGCSLSDGTNEPLLNMCEPTYILYTYKRLLDKKPINGILFSAAAENEGSVLPKSSILTKLDPGDIYNYGYITDSISYPVATDIQSSIISTGTYPYRVIRLYAPTPIIEYSTDDSANAMSYYDNGDIPDVVVYNMRNIPSTTPLHDSIYPDRFHAFSNTVAGNIADVPVQLGTEIYDIRSPSSAVLDNWLNQRYTPREADYLNDLNLRPAMMLQIFGVDWPKQVSQMLTYITQTKCFSDNSLSNDQCKGLEEIINKVLTYFVQNELDVAGMVEKEERQAKAMRQSIADETLNASVNKERDMKKLLSDLGVSQYEYDNYVKDPLQSGILFKLPEDHNSSLPPTTMLTDSKKIDLYKGNMAYLIVKATSKLKGTIIWGYIGSTKGDTDASKQDIMKKCGILEEAYTGYVYDYFGKKP